jgi:hypothetical protein
MFQITSYETDKIGYKNTDNNIPLGLLDFVDSKIEMKNAPLDFVDYCNIYVCPIDLLGLFSGCKFPI